MISTELQVLRKAITNNQWWETGEREWVRTERRKIRATTPWRNSLFGLVFNVIHFYFTTGDKHEWPSIIQTSACVLGGIEVKILEVCAWLKVCGNRHFLSDILLHFFSPFFLVFSFWPLVYWYEDDTTCLL